MVEIGCGGGENQALAFWKGKLDIHPWQLQLRDALPFLEGGSVVLDSALVPSYKLGHGEGQRLG